MVVVVGGGVDVVVGGGVCVGGGVDVVVGGGVCVGGGVAVVVVVGGGLDFCEPPGVGRGWCHDEYLRQNISTCPCRTHPEVRTRCLRVR